MPETPKQPQDHKKKADENLFSFEHDGETYTFPVAPRKILTPGWLRKNRRRDEADLMFTVIEAMAGDDEKDPALKAVDTMSSDEFTALQEQLQKFNEATVGESSASSTS